MSKFASPPRLAEWLVKRASGPDESPLVANDFREAFENQIIAAGIAHARRWYWAEALRSIAPLARRRLERNRRRASAERPAIFDSIVDDVRYSLRITRRTPLASGAIIATLVLGIGSTTAVFSVMNGVLLKPLPFSESERVVELQAIVPSGAQIQSLAYPDLLDFRRMVPDFSDLTFYREQDQTLQHGADPQVLRIVQVAENYPRVFRTRVLLGRWFISEENALNAPKVAVLSHQFWMREFGGDRSIVGQTVSLDNESVQVIGVLSPDAYTYPAPGADALTPLIIVPNTPMTNRGSMWAGSSARLKPGVTIDGARRALRSVSALISKDFPKSNTGVSAHLVPLQASIVGPVQAMLELLAAAVASVLLIACINVANLILGRAQTRSREFAVRSAMGGSLLRVRQQILTESLFLAMIGGVLGVSIAPLLTRMLIAVYPETMPRAEEIGVDWRVLLVAVVSTMIAGSLSALPTVRRAGRLDLTRDLREGNRSGIGRGEHRVGRILVVAQVAASLALLFGAGLLLRTFSQLTRVRPGFDARNTMTFHVYAPVARYSASNRYYERATAALREIPGVREVASTSALPFAGGQFSDTYIFKELGDQGTKNPHSLVAFVSPGYERAIGLPVIRGRAFAVSDDSTSEPVVVINDALAKRFFPSVDPIGHVVDWNYKSWRIVGVVASSYVSSLWEEAPPILYASTGQSPRRGRYFVVRSDMSADKTLAAARAALHRVDPTIALTEAESMSERVDASLQAHRFRAAMMGSLGGLALLLAVIGIYSVVAHAVTRRTREIGIRMALGEASRDVQRRVVGDAMRVASVGIGVGVVLALVAGRWLSVFLVGVSPRDPILLIGSALGLAALVCGAAFGPARRAARVDPVMALRSE